MPRCAKVDEVEIPEVEIPFEKGEFISDLRCLAKEFIKRFFVNKNWYCGGPIPEAELTSDWAVQTVLLTPFEDKIFDYIHSECLSNIPSDPNYSNPGVPWSIHVLLDLINDLRSLDIAKDFQPGLLLLYFKFCRGIEIPEHPLL